MVILGTEVTHLHWGWCLGQPLFPLPFGYDIGCLMWLMTFCRHWGNIDIDVDLHIRIAFCICLPPCTYFVCFSSFLLPPYEKEWSSGNIPCKVNISLPICWLLPFRCVFFSFYSFIDLKKQRKIYWESYYWVEGWCTHSLTCLFLLEICWFVHCESHSPLCLYSWGFCYWPSLCLVALIV